MDNDMSGKCLFEQKNMIVHFIHGSVCFALYMATEVVDDLISKINKKDIFRKKWYSLGKGKEKFLQIKYSTDHTISIRTHM